MEHPNAQDMANKYQRDAAWWREEAGRLVDALNAIGDCDMSDPDEYRKRRDAILVDAICGYHCALFDSEVAA